MSRIPFIKRAGALIPYDDAAKAVLDKFGQGTVIWMDPKQPRNERHHRKYWALISLVWDNVDHEQYPSPEDLHDAIKISVGLRTRIHLPSGKLAYRAGSIAFSKMDQTEFSKFYDRVCDLIAKHFLPGVTSETLKHEVEQLTGIV